MHGHCHPLPPAALMIVRAVGNDTGLGFQIVKAPERSAVKRLRSLKKTIENALSGAQFLARLMLLRVAELYSLVAKAAKTERQKGEEHGENEEEGL